MYARYDITAIEKSISDLFSSLAPDIYGIIEDEAELESATKAIMSLVSSRITGSSYGWLSSLYTSLSTQTLKEPEFQPIANANKFYALDLGNVISTKYKLNITSLESYSKGVNGDFTIQEINRAYGTAAATVGSAALGGILLAVLSGAIDLPLVAIIGGAIAFGLIGGGIAYGYAIPKYNKSRYKQTISEVLASIKDELISWIRSIADFYTQEVENLKATLK